MSFYLVELRPSGEVPLQQFSFRTGSQAGSAARDLTALGRFKVQPRRLADAPDWRPRAQGQIDDGIRRPLPEGWDLEPIRDHYAHLVPRGDDCPMIGFYESEQAGLFDRVTQVKPGRYLERYYPGLADADRRRLISLVDPPIEVLFAETREEIRHVYINGPSSCMSPERRKEWAAVDLPCHPVEVYAAGDLAVAYIKNRDGRISARALCKPDDRIYGRLYGDESRLEKALTDLDFSFVEDLDPVKILKIPTGNKDDEWVLPYFDNIGWLKDAGDHFISANIREGEHKGVVYAPVSYNGFSEKYRWCPKMNGYEWDSRFQFVHGVNEDWSQNAINNYAFQCDATRQWWPSTERVVVTGGGYWSKAYFEKNGFVCDLTRNRYPNTDLLILEDGRKVSRSYHEQQEAQRLFREERRRQEEELRKRRAERKPDSPFGSYEDLLFFAEPARFTIDINALRPTPVAEQVFETASFRVHGQEVNVPVQISRRTVVEPPRIDAVQLSFDLEAEQRRMIEQIYRDLEPVEQPELLTVNFPER